MSERCDASLADKRADAPFSFKITPRRPARRVPRRAKRSDRRKPSFGANGAKGPVRRQLSEKGVEKRLFSKDRSAEIDRRVILFLSARCTVKNYRTVRTGRNGCRQADQAVGCLHLICVKPYINSINFSRSSASEAARETAYFRFFPSVCEDLLPAPDASEPPKQSARNRL